MLGGVPRQDRKRHEAEGKEDGPLRFGRSQ